MSDFIVYTSGNVAFLGEVFNAIAMITGHGDFKQVVAIGLFLGVLIIMFQSLFAGAKEIQYQQILLGWMLYAMFFVPTTTVIIEHNNTGETMVVDNVPIGIGFTGGMISHIGTGMSNLFVTGFTTVDATVQRGQFNETLDLINQVRRKAYSPEVFEAVALNFGGGSVDAYKSLYNYIKDCSLTKITINQTSVEKLLAQDLYDAIKFNSASNAHGTRLFLDPSLPLGQDVDCATGWSQSFGIKELLDNVDSQNVQKAFDQAMSRSSSSPGTSDLITKLTSARGALGLSVASAQQFVATSIAEGVYQDAAEGKYKDMLDFNAALAIRQAVQQRNIQWAGEQTLFMTTVQPFMSYFEGFIYGILPFMAFLIVLGQMGIKLGIKYFQILLWIQLWTPVLAITNMYINLATKAALKDIDGTSFYALNDVLTRIETYLAVGGKMASATPVISFFIISGSAYAFTSIASKIGGADHFNEKQMTPDVRDANPYLAGGSTASYSPNLGGSYTDMASSLPSISAASGLGSAISSKNTHQQQAIASQEVGAMKMLNSTGSASQTSNRAQTVGSMIMAGTDSASQKIQGQVKQLAERHDLSRSQQNAVASKLGGGLGLSIPGTKIGFGGELSRNGTNQQTSLLSDVEQFSKENKFSKSESNSFKKSMSEAIAKTNASGFENSVSASEMDSQRKLISDRDTATEQFETAQSFQNTAGMNAQWTGQQWSTQVNENYSAKRALNDYFAANSGLNSSVNDLSEKYQKVHGIDEGRANTLAQGVILQDQMGEPDRSFGAVSAFHDVMRGLGVQSPTDDQSAFNNQEIVEQVEGNGALIDAARGQINDGVAMEFEQVRKDAKSQTAVVIPEPAVMSAEARVQAGDPTDNTIPELKPAPRSNADAAAQSLLSAPMLSVSAIAGDPNLDSNAVDLPNTLVPNIMDPTGFASTFDVETSPPANYDSDYASYENGITKKSAKVQSEFGLTAAQGEYYGALMSSAGYQGSEHQAEDLNAIRMEISGGNEQLTPQQEDVYENITERIRDASLTSFAGNMGMTLIGRYNKDTGLQ